MNGYEVFKMDGFNVFKDNDVINEYENGAGKFRLLVEDNDIEIFESNINAGKSIICQPYESEDSINISYVISGKLYHTNGRHYILPGERFTFKNLKETHHLSVIENTKLIMIRKNNFFTAQVTTMDEIYSFIHKIQEKDLYTEDHCNKTGNLAVQIATFMKLPDNVIENVIYAGKIHDVGKIDIPEEILNKPAKLSNEEFEIIKQHPQVGYDIVMKSMGNESLARVVLEHHERLDGSGYPNNLTADEISIEAKIIAVADSFDAMTSNRPYRKAMKVEDALIELKKHLSTWYDPEVVRVVEEIVEINKSHTHL